MDYIQVYLNNAGAFLEQTLLKISYLKSDVTTMDINRM